MRHGTVCYVYAVRVQYYVQSGLAPYRAHALTSVINLLNRVPQHDSLAFFVLRRTKCKPMHFEWERLSDVTLTLTLTPNPNPNPKP